MKSDRSAWRSAASLTLLSALLGMPLAVASGSPAAGQQSGVDASAASPIPTQVAEAAGSESAQAQNGIDLEQSLKNIKRIAHRVRGAALHVVNDVEERDMVVVGEPELIQPIAWKDKNKISWAREMLELGPAQPPKKKWLDTDVGNLGEQLDLLRTEVQQSGVPADLEGTAADEWAQVKTVVQDADRHFQELQELSKGPKYDNIAIGKAALEIYEDMAKLEHPWKNLVTITRAKK